MQKMGERAVVIGASIGGLLAARVLTDAYEQVTIVERDELPAGHAARRAIPQGRHVHALLPAGERCLEELLPGLPAQMVGAGATSYTALSEMRFVINGHELARAAAPRPVVSASRPFIEGHVRRRVAALPGVELVTACDVVGLLADAGRERISGVRILRREAGSAAEDLAADLVVAATGRGSRLPAWLESLGYPRPQEDRLAIDVGYATRRLRLRPGALGPDKAVIIGARRDLPRGMFLFAQEHGRWLLTLQGFKADRPPADADGFLAFAASIAPPEVMAAIRDAEMLDDEIPTHRFPADLRRRYERMSRLPAGLLPLGDAICSFNPVYGQGMTVAALEACALRDCLAKGAADLQRRYLRAASRIVDDAWQLATGADLSLPVVDGPRPLPVRAVNAYMERLHAAAERDRELALAFMRVVGMLDRPAALLKPRVVARVLGARPRRRRVALPATPADAPA